MNTQQQYDYDEILGFFVILALLTLEKNGT